MSGGNQPVFLPIAPKPPALLTRGQLSTFTVTKPAGSISEINAPPMDSSTLPILCTQPQQPIFETSSQANSSGPAPKLDEILSELECILDKPRTTDDIVSLPHRSLVIDNQLDSPDLNDWIENFNITPLELLEDSIDCSTHVQVIMDISFYKRIL